MSSPTDNIAAGVFVKAAARLLVLQDNMLKLRMELEQVDHDAGRANEAALREAGINEAMPFDEVLDVQERFMEQAIEASGLPRESPVVGAVRRQFHGARLEYAEATKAEADAFGSVNGKAL